MPTPRLLHLADLETIYDDPERLGRLAGAIDAARDDRTLVVGAGDTSALGALAFESDDGRAIARPFYDRVEPVADTLGNHEFDFGLDGAIDWARTTPGIHLVANTAGVAHDDGRWTGLQPSTVVDCAGERLGLIGVAHPETAELSGHDLDVELTDPVEAVRTEADRLRAEGPDWLVVLSHAGPIDAEIAAETDVDVVLGGHDHDAVRERIDGTLLSRTEGGQAGVYQIVELGDSPSVTTRSVDPAPRVEPIETAYRDLADEQGLTAGLGTLPEPLDHAETATLVADAYRTRGDADVGLVAAASVRGGLPERVTRGDVVGAVPFGSELDVHRLSGDALRAIADRCADPLDATHGGLVAAGLEAEPDDEALVNGRSIDPADDYRLGCMSYLTVVAAVPELDGESLVESRGPQHEHVLTTVADAVTD